MPAPLLVLDGLTKDYGRSRALDSLTISVQPGEVLGLLGPNGSGKSTALRLVLGFLRPTRGTATLGGFDCWKQSVQARKLVSYLPGELRLYENMTGRQIVTFLCQLRNAPLGDFDGFARKLDVDPDRPLTQLSSGMKRKIALLAVLTPDVPLIILDEPTNTLDPVMRDEFLDQVRLAKKAGKAVLFSSHVLQEVEAVCDRVAILRAGKLLHLPTLAELGEGRRIAARLTGPAPEAGPSGEAIEIRDGRMILEARGPLPRLLDWLKLQPLADLTIEPLGLRELTRDGGPALG